MIEDDIKVIHPQGLRIAEATVSLTDMGESTITATVNIDGEGPTDFSEPWELEFRGHRFIMPLRKPQASKGNEALTASAELTFRHRAEYELRRWFFPTMQAIDSGTAVPDLYEATVSLNLYDFCDLFKQVLAYYYGDTITLDLNPDWVAKSEPTNVAISKSYIWDVLITLYDNYGVRWKIEPGADAEHYVIKVGYDADSIDHIFSYGYEGGLLKGERQVQDDDIRNMIMGRGGEKNLPYRYFKRHDEDNASFSPDPDWIPELESIYFSALRGATFRSYIQGWRAAHIEQYRKDYPDEDWTLTVANAEDAYAPWAWMRGYTDTKFNPVEYVADGFTTEAAGYAVASGSSIDTYGELMGAADDDEDIYPTIQGVSIDPYGRIDEVVAVEEVTTDDIAEATEAEAKVRDYDYRYNTATYQPGESGTIRVYVGSFTLADGESATIEPSGEDYTARDYYGSADLGPYVALSGTNVIIRDEYGDELPSGAGVSGAGTYSFYVEFHVSNTHATRPIIITVAVNGAKVVIGTASQRTWKNTFDIWIKNIWGTEQLAGESDTAYAKRVWQPILGDREGEEAKVVFASGALSISEDYEFVITDIPVCERKTCEWETTENGKLVKRSYTSEWRITLAKTDADMESLGVYQPSVTRQAVAGDYFYFIGIDMPHLYVKWAEELLDDTKKDYLKEVCDIKPTWVVTADRVRLNGHGEAGALIESIAPGNTVRLADPRLIDSPYETLHIQTVTLTYRKPSNDDPALNPDVEFTLSDDFSSTASPLATLSGEVSVLSRQIGSLSNIEQVMRAIGDKLYLRKDGVSDISLSPTTFASLLKSNDFRAGMVGGSGWSFYRDASGRWVLEIDALNVRQEMAVNTIVINQVEGRGGMTVESDAAMEVTEVEEVTDSDGYLCHRCRFDTKYGSVGNLFKVGDVAYCSQFDADNAALRYYKRRVMGVGADYVDLLSKESVVSLSWPDNGAVGDGDPREGDCIVHYGSYTDPDRRFVIVRDVMGGGYERFIEGLDSVTATGTEYFFVGRQSGQYNGRPRFFLGDEDSFISYENGKLSIKANLSIQSTIDGKTLSDYVTDEALNAIGYTLACDNDMAAIACDANGDVTGSYPSPKVTLWHGTEDVTTEASLFIESIEPSKSIEAHIDSSGAVSVGSLAEDVATITVGALIDDVTLTTAISVYKVKPGANGVTLTHTSVRYAKSYSETQPEDSAFKYSSIEDANVGPGGYLWVMTEQTYSDGNRVVAYSVSRVGTDGSGVSITSQYVRYSTLNTASQPADSTFTLDDVPSIGAGSYLWSMTVVVYSDGSSTKSYAVSRIGVDGETPTLFFLEVTPGNVTRAADGSMSAQSILAVKQTVTGSVRKVTTEKIIAVRESFADGSEQESVLVAAGTDVAGTYQIPSGLTAVTFVLYDSDGVTVLDTQRVPVLDDASGLIVSGENLLLNSGRWYNETDGAAPRHWGWVNNTPSTSYSDGALRIVHSVTDGWSGICSQGTDAMTVPPGAQVRVIAKFTVSGLSDESCFVRLGLVHPWDAYMTADVPGNGTFEISKLFTNGTDYSEWRAIFNLSDGFDGTVTLEYMGVFLGNADQAWTPSPRDRYDYLSAALGDAQLYDTDIDGGLVLTSAIKAGYDASDGSRVTMAGMNGVYTDETAPSLWAGGDGSDLASSEASSSSRPAQWLVRMDGTGYAAGNTLRFRKAALGVGPSATADDTIVLDDSGLHLMDATGFERLSVADSELPEDVFTAISPEQVATGAALNLGTVTFAACGGTATPRYGGALTHYPASEYNGVWNGNYHINSGASRKVALTGLVSGARVRVTLTVNLSVTSYDSAAFPYLPSKCNCGYSFIAVDGVVLAQGPSSSALTADFTYKGDSDEVEVEIGVLSSEIFGQWYNAGMGSVTADYSLTGSNKYASKNMLGNNGMLSIWGDAMLLATASGVAMRHGKFGLRVCADGIQYNKAGTADGWQTLV